MTTDQSSRKRQRTSTKDQDDDDSKKQRGRPRVDGQDETAADRRRTQIRLAQRAYRQRKENTIATLKDQVNTLRSAVSEMNKAFLAFNDRVVASNLLQSNPDLARELRNTTERFLNLARTADSPSSEGPESDMDQWNILSAETAPEPSPQTPPTTQANGVRMIDIGLGYVQMIDEPVAHGQLTPPDEYPDVSLTTGETSPPFDSPGRSAVPDFTLFPNRSGDSIANFEAPYNAQFPNDNRSMSRSNVIISPLKSISMPAPYTFSVNEITFARRLQRAGFERAFHLLAKSESRPEAFKRVFRLSLPYHSRESLMAKLRYSLTTTTNEPLEVDHTPFIHLGGAGTHYATSRKTNSYAIKFGPNKKARLQHVGTGLDPGIEFDIDMKEYEGTWFDANDVEGFLEELGMSMDPSTSFVEANVSDSGPLMELLRRNGILNHSETKSDRSSWSGHNSNSPPIPIGQTIPESIPSKASEGNQSDARLFQELGMAGLEDLTWTGSEVATAAGWLMGSGDKTPEFLSSGWNGYVWNPVDAMNDTLLSPPQPLETTQEVMRKVTLDVGGLIDYTISRAICLGRAPGFKKKDVEQAIVASVIEIT